MLLFDFKIDMNFSFFTICVLIQFLVVNCLIFPVVFAKTLSKKESSYDKNLTDNKSYKCFNKNSNNNNESNFKNVCSEDSINVNKSSWFLNTPLLPVIVASSNSIPEGSCKKQLLLYLHHLKNGTLWATEMFDSSAKYPYGLFDGFTRHLGSFDQCERIYTKIINNDDEGIEEIRSRYCLVDVKFKEENEPSDFIGIHNITFDPQGSAWEAIRENGDFRRYRRYLLQMALCFPAKCETEDIVTALKQPLDEFGAKYNIQIEASISPLYCSSDASKKAPFSNYEIIFCLAFFLILSIVIISTIIDIISDNKKQLSLGKELLYCFSASKNCDEIFNIDYGHRGFDSIHFIRGFLALVAVISHRQLQYMYGGTINGQYFEWVLSNPMFGLAHNISLIIDGFYGIGGLLLSYTLLEKLNSSGKLNYLRLILIRLVRLLPLYMFVTFAYATIFHRLGSGPFWEVSVGFNRDSCSSYWWTNLFFINNYFGGNNKCVIQSWYLAVDFQLFLVGLLLITAFYKIPRKIGYIFLGCILISSSAVTFYFTYKNDADPLYKSFTTPRRVEEMDFFLNYYVKTHLRLSSYATGLIFGVFIYEYKNFNWSLSKTWSQILFPMAILLAFSITWSGTLFMNPNLKFTSFTKALYASVQRSIFAFSICAIPLLLLIGDGLDFYYNLFTIKWFQPLSRISFSIFLTHYAILLYELGTTRTTFTFSIYNAVKLIVGDIVYSVLLGFFFAILMEFPFRNVGNIFLKKKRVAIKRNPSSDIQKETE